MVGKQIMGVANDENNMNGILNRIAAWCKLHKKLCVRALLLFAFISVMTVYLAYLLIRSSYVPAITVRLLDVDTNSPIEDALVEVFYYGGAFDVYALQEARGFTDSSGVVIFPARMVWGHWIIPNSYLHTAVVYEHYSYMSDVIRTRIEHPSYFADEIRLEAFGKSMDRLNDSYNNTWESQVLKNLYMISERYFKACSEMSVRPKVTPEQVAAHYEMLADTYLAKYPNSRGTSISIVRKKIAELRTRRY